MRNIVVVMPEDELVKLVTLAQAEGITSNEFAARAIRAKIKESR